MKREIKFRAKIAATDVWILGLPYAVYSDNNIDSIQCIETKQVEYIKTDTLGQFTGLKDKNGKEIYEGDIITIESASRHKNELHTVIFENGAFCIKNYNGKLNSNELNSISFHRAIFECYEATEQYIKINIIGNIFENPELL